MGFANTVFRAGFAAEYDAAPIATEFLCGGPEMVDRIAREWRELCVDSGDDQPFYRPEWVAAYLRSFVPRAHVVLVTARTGGRLTAVLPLVRERSLAFGFPARLLRSANNVHCCRFNLVCAAGAEGQASAAAVWRHLREAPGWDVLALRDVPAGSAADQLLGQAGNDAFGVIRRDSIVSPFINIPAGAATFAPYQFIPNPRSRNSIGRRWRKAVAAGNLVLRRVDCAHEVELRRFFDLEQSGWKGANKSAIANSPATLAFYTAMARAAAQDSYLALYFLELNSTIIAGHLGLHLAGRYYSPKLAYDEGYEDYAPGHLIVGAILRDCSERGATQFDFVGHTAPWKEKWATGATAHVKGYVFHQRLRGRALHAAARQRFQLQARLQPYLNRL